MRKGGWGEDDWVRKERRRDCRWKWEFIPSCPLKDVRGENRGKKRMKKEVKEVKEDEREGRREKKRGCNYTAFRRRVRGAYYAAHT